MIFKNGKKKKHDRLSSHQINTFSSSSQMNTTFRNDFLLPPEEGEDGWESRCRFYAQIDGFPEVMSSVKTLIDTIQVFKKRSKRAPKKIFRKSY